PLQTALPSVPSNLPALPPTTLSSPPRLRPPPPSALFPYTTLFRSAGLRAVESGRVFQCHRQRAGARHEGPRVRRRRHQRAERRPDRKSTRPNSSHDQISYAVFCLKKKKKKSNPART